LKRAFLLAAFAALLLPGCASSRIDASEREWARGQCGQVIDPEAREKCLRRIEDTSPSTKAPSR
jgi:hypothetical protein